MDNIEDIDINFDSSFLIGLEAQKRNYEIFYYNPQNLIYNEGLIQADGFYIELVENDKKYFKYLTKKISVNLDNFQYIFIRQDPPFDMNYITSTYLLDYLPSTTIVINNPTANKRFPLISRFIPETSLQKSSNVIINALISNNETTIYPQIIKIMSYMYNFAPWLIKFFIYRLGYSN